MKTPLITLSVTRDAMTTVPTSVPPHELDILRAVFGEENVQESDEEAGSVDLDPAAEGDRLVAKYGLDPVKQVFGSNFQSAAARALSSNEAKAKKAAAAA